MPLEDRLYHVVNFKGIRSSVALCLTRITEVRMKKRAHARCASRTRHIATDDSSGNARRTPVSVLSAMAAAVSRACAHLPRLALPQEVQASTCQSLLFDVEVRLPASGYPVRAGLGTARTACKPMRAAVLPLTPHVRMLHRCCCRDLVTAK